MEISFVEEDAHIEIIKGYKALRYRAIDNGKNINKIPVFQRWLKLMKAEKGENGIIIYCTKCYSFFYLESLRLNDIYHGDCNKFDYSEFCEYCNELFHEYSICCLRKSFDMFKRFSYKIFFDIFGIGILFLPIIALMWAFLAIFIILTSKRIKKYHDIHHIYKLSFEIFKSLPYFIFFSLISFSYSITYLVPYFFTIYFFQLSLMIKIHRQKLEDYANHIIRY